MGILLKYSVMKKLTTFIALLLISTSVIAQKKVWKVDPAHSKISFNVTHLLITEVNGQFKEYVASIKSDREDFSDANISFELVTSSIDTDNNRRDKHLRSEDFFDVENHPKIIFKGKRMRKMEDKKYKKLYKLIGDLTMNGITKEVTFDVKHAGIIKDIEGNTKAGFKVTGIINRYDFGLKWNIATETDIWAVSKEVEIVCNLQLLLDNEVKLTINAR
jgi:polyisoprenoid-binding protein YceI